MENYAAECGKLGISPKPEFTVDEKGNTVLRSCQRNIPTGKGVKGIEEKIFIYVQKERTTDQIVNFEHKSPFDYKIIDTGELAAFQREGWTEWFCPPSLQPPDGPDKRVVDYPNDIWDLDKPHEDTPKLFEEGIGISRRLDGLGWETGDVLSKNPEEETPLSTASNFVSTGEATSLQSATSRTHIPMYRRPFHVPVGWGDHDRCREWMIHGRQVKPEHLSEGTDNPTIPEDIVTYVSEEGAPGGVKIETTKPLPENVRAALSQCLPKEEALTIGQMMTRKADNAEKGRYDGSFAWGTSSKQGGRYGRRGGRVSWD